MNKFLNYNYANFEEAWDTWGMNCGPGALCAILNKTPNMIRDHLFDFEEKGYMDPDLMIKSLESQGTSFTSLFSNIDATPQEEVQMPVHGLVRVQWGGPWIGDKPNHYRHSHWIAVSGGKVFDHNAINHDNGWLSWEDWENKLIPWVLEDCEPDWDGTWWITHSLEVHNHPQPVVIKYTNWKGQVSDRRILPIGTYWGSNEWHPEDQWLLVAQDLDKGAIRHFAHKDIQAWGPPKNS